MHILAHTHTFSLSSRQINEWSIKKKYYKYLFRVYLTLKIIHYSIFYSIHHLILYLNNLILIV